MARFLLSAMPFTGHVAPMLALAEALVARGHDVRVHTGSAFAAKTAATGAALVPWRQAPDFDENDLTATFPRLRGKKGIRQVFVNIADLMIGTAPAQVADLATEWDREPWDALVGDEISVGAVLFAERSSCRFATLAVLPLNLASCEGPPSGMGLTPGTTPLMRVRDALLRAALPLGGLPLRGPLARARSDTGLPRSSATFEQTVFSRGLVLASGSPLLDFGRTDRPSHVQFVGVLARSTIAAFDPPGWWRDLDDREVVCVTQGTQNIDPADLLRPALDALAGEDVLVVATTGIPGRDELPFPVPANARVAGFLPYAHLLPHVDVLVTNGGWGGTLTALGHGIPLVVAGGDLDKPEVAARVAWSGAGVNLRTGTPSTRAVREAVQRVRTEPAFRAAAARVATQLQLLGGADTAASALEAFAAEGVSRPTDR
ncbi:glycosyltransferase [Microbacterium sp.]|uniref:glycosyltransferase n=1 Tax=Microbacterium sp. TaxID=51671 RepID=UPI0039E6C0AE